MTADPASGSASLLDAIRAQPGGPGKFCSVGPFIASLTKEQQDAISQAQAERIQGTKIGRWLVGLGYEGQPGTVTRHLSGFCRCPR